MYYQILITNFRTNVTTGRENLHFMLGISGVELIPSTEQSVADVKQVDFSPSFWKQLCWIIRVLGAVRLQLHNKVKILIRNAPRAIQKTLENTKEWEESLSSRILSPQFLLGVAKQPDVPLTSLWRDTFRNVSISFFLVLWIFWRIECFTDNLQEL